MSEQKRSEPAESAPEPSPDAVADRGRRGFVGVVAAGSCAIAATLGVPAALFVAAPLSGKAGAGKRFAVGHLDDLTPGVPKKVMLVGDEVDAWTRATGRRLGAVWLLRTGERDVRALSTICPHLGCGVEASADGKGFGCPCHDSNFDLAGQRTSGPSPRAMDALPLEIGPAGELQVTFQRFRIGVSEKEELG